MIRLAAICVGALCLTACGNPRVDEAHGIAREAYASALEANSRAEALEREIEDLTARIDEMESASHEHY